MQENLKYFCSKCNVRLHPNPDNIFMCLECKKQVEFKDGLKGIGNDQNKSNVIVESGRWKIQELGVLETRSITPEDKIDKIYIEFKPVVITR